MMLLDGVSKFKQKMVWKRKKEKIKKNEMEKFEWAEHAHAFQITIYWNMSIHWPVFVAFCPVATNSFIWFLFFLFLFLSLVRLKPDTRCSSANQRPMCAKSRAKDTLLLLSHRKNHNFAYHGSLVHGIHTDQNCMAWHVNSKSNGRTVHCVRTKKKESQTSDSNDDYTYKHTDILMPMAVLSLFPTLFFLLG